MVKKNEERWSYSRQHGVLWRGRTVMTHAQVDEHFRGGGTGDALDALIQKRIRAQKEAERPRPEDWEDKYGWWTVGP
jgi:hypothetical protein